LGNFLHARFLFVVATPNQVSVILFKSLDAHRQRVTPLIHDGSVLCCFGRKLLPLSLSPDFLNLVISDDAEPTHKAGLRLKLVLFFPNHHGHFLNCVVDIGCIAQKGHQVTKQPTLVLHKQPHHNLTLFSPRFHMLRRGVRGN